MRGFVILGANLTVLFLSTRVTTLPPSFEGGHPTFDASLAWLLCETVFPTAQAFRTPYKGAILMYILCSFIHNTTTFYDIL